MADETGTEEKGKGGVLSLALPALLAGGVALGVSYLDPLGGRGAEAAETAGTHAEAPDASKSKDKAKGKGKGKGKGGADILVLDPMIVSLTQAAPGRTGPRLRVGVALRAPGGADETETLMLRDGFTAAVHGIEPTTLAGPDGLSALRAALLEAARGVLGEDAVEGVLITDYVLI